MRRAAADRLHGPNCRRACCRPQHPVDVFARRLGWVTWAAIATGLALIFVVDRVMCGPGILCIFGY